MRILKKLTRPNAPQATEVFHQVVTFLAAMFMPERIHEGERFDQLFCPNQKTAAIDFPLIRIVHVRPPLKLRCEVCSDCEFDWGVVA